MQRETKRIKLENSLPVHIGISPFSKIFLVVATNKSMHKINAEMKEKASAKELHLHYLETFYPHSKTS